MKRIAAIITFIIPVILLAVSCKETKEADDHANWQDRNTEFISKIASECNPDLTPQTAQEGQLFRLLSFKLDPDKAWSDGSYIYCRILNKSSETLSPHYTDSIRMNYRVRLMSTDNYPEGQVIDQSFKTTQLDPSVNIPYSFLVSSLIDGVTTAVMNMHEGDFWRVYIPYGLGYGTNDKGSIPGYSALIYEINLTEIAPTGHDLSPR